jgi:hypothetical protein
VPFWGFRNLGRCASGVSLCGAQRCGFSAARRLWRNLTRVPCRRGMRSPLPFGRIRVIRAFRQKGPYRENPMATICLMGPPRAAARILRMNPDKTRQCQ